MRQLIIRATDLLAGQHNSIARAIGVTPHALVSWRRGARNPTAENIARLGEELVHRAREIQLAGFQLIKAAAEMRQPMRRSERQPGEVSLFEDSEL